MENKCWKEREIKHTHLERWTCASGIWVTRDTNEVLVIELPIVGKVWVWTCLQISLRFKWKLKRTVVLFFFFFFTFSSLFYSSFFMLLWTFKQPSTFYSSRPPCLNDCSSSTIEVSGPMAAREVQNPCVPLQIFWSLQGHPPCRNSTFDESIHMLYILKSLQENL
jgi:hypothetical protein